MSLLVVGVSHHSAPIGVLEKVAITQDDVEHVLDEILKSEHIGQAVLLSTCNRVEVYAGITTFHGALTDIGAALANHARVPLPELATYCYAHYAEEGARHIFRVAAGLDSMVIGEPQILGQLRGAYHQATTQRTVETLLHEVMQRALRTGKRVHAETAIDHAGQSVVTAALEVAQPLLPAPARQRVVIVGAGSMAALAATTISRQGFGALTILNRTTNRATRLAASVNGHAGTLAELPTALRDADLVISATGASEVLISADMVARARHDRHDQPLVICDLAIPRDVDASVRQLPGVTVVDVTALAQTKSATPTQADVAAATEIVEAELADFASWQRAVHVAPTVAALRDHADDVVAQELLTLRSRLPALSPEVQAEIERAVRRAVATLLHAPTVRMKELAAAPDGDRYAAAVRELFLLDVAHASAEAAIAATLPATEVTR